VTIPRSTPNLSTVGCATAMKDGRITCTILPPRLAILATMQAICGAASVTGLAARGTHRTQSITSTSPKTTTHSSPGSNPVFDFSVRVAYDEDMNHTRPDMYDRLQFLQQYRHIAIVGISADQYRPSHFVAIYLQAEGYDIVL